jgi:hypothetical protein
MYKIKTNQTDLPLSRVQIRASTSTSSPSAAALRANRSSRPATSESSSVAEPASSRSMPPRQQSNLSSGSLYHGASKLRENVTWTPSSPALSDGGASNSSDVIIDIEALRPTKKARIEEAAIDVVDAGQADMDRRHSAISLPVSELRDEGRGLQGKAADGLLSLMGMQ